jgi:hypothetical protein
VQDAPRKRKDPSQTPVALAGSIFHTEGGTITVSVSQEQWEKVKVVLTWLELSMLESDTIEHKWLESYRGFLIYLVHTYPDMNPYLKGIHLTLDSWRPWRREDGWKLTMAEIRIALEEKCQEYHSNHTSANKAPVRVKWVPRLVDDVRALRSLFKVEEPAKRLVCSKEWTSVSYSFGDASSSGFGSSMVMGETVCHKSGQWDEGHAKQSSNYRELRNLIYTIEEQVARGQLRDTELFIFTDKSTAEQAFYNGTSTSPTLFELVLRLQNLQMNQRLLVHFVHVAGTRIMAQGTDGLSQGSMPYGVI